MSFPPLHVITDDAVLAADTFLAGALTVLDAGGARVALHLRGPGTTAAALHALALTLAHEARRRGARLIVNDRVDVALAAGAHGVQLGHRSLHVSDVRAIWKNAWIGSSVHSPDEVARSAAAGTDFVVLGTIWATPSHPGRPGAGPDTIRAATAVAPVPVVAIGGIDAARMAAVRQAGASGAAVLSAVWRAPDGAYAVGRLLDAWDTQGG